MSEAEPNADAHSRETTAYRAAIEAFVTKLVEQLGEPALANLVSTAHEHKSLVVLAPSMDALAVRVQISFGERVPREKLQELIDAKKAGAPVSP